MLTLRVLRTMLKIRLFVAHFFVRLVRVSGAILCHFHNLSQAVIECFVVYFVNIF